jgi:hypothetical protein
MANPNKFTVAQQPSARKKPGRKPGSLNKPKINPDGSSATNTDASKPKRTRRPRDPNAPPIQRRKKTVLPELMANPKPVSSVASKQLKLADMSLRPSDATFNVPPPKQSPDPPIPPTSQIGKTEDIPRPMNSFFNSAPPPTQAPVRTSGQNYDPIRSNYDPVRETVVSSHNTFNNSQMSPKYNQMPNRASASPSISSLVDPPHQASTSPSVATQSFVSHQLKMQNQEGHHSVPPSPTSNRPAPSPMMNTIATVQPQAGAKVERQPEPWVKAPVPAHFTLGNSPVTAPAPAPSTNTKKTTPNTAMSAASSAAPSPKPPKPIDVTPPPLPGSGNGLLQNGMFGNGPKDGTESRAPTIVLHIPMNGETNKYVNFSRLAEERYGWEALHPRLAAQRERLARVAAAGAALEKNSTHKESGDEMSLDISEGEGDGSNVEMGGMSDGRTGTDGGKKQTKKRKMKEDEYDKDDGFVDDSELLWEEQAAASKDGFFVYSGPLVPEGEKPQFEKFVLQSSIYFDILLTSYRADGVAKRGRGGRGRGVSRGTTSTRGGGTAGGPGSRGGNVTRKPRITKADREKMNQEKAEREKMGALAAKPSGYAGMSQLASAPSMGGTPMVFNQ